jgi:hypothetical protein
MSSPTSSNRKKAGSRSAEQKGRSLAGLDPATAFPPKNGLIRAQGQDEGRRSVTFKSLFLLGAASALASCGQSSDSSNLTDAAANAAAHPKKKPAYCFFKDAETKEWAISRDKDGNVTVTGKVFRSDPRYKAVLQPPVTTGTSAEISPTITTNDTGYAAPENWWDVKTVIPNSAAIETVRVSCGSRTLADVKLPPKS